VVVAVLTIVLVEVYPSQRDESSWYTDAINAEEEY